MNSYIEFLMQFVGMFSALTAMMYIKSAKFTSLQYLAYAVVSFMFAQIWIKSYI